MKKLLIFMALILFTSSLTADPVDCSHADFNKGYIYAKLESRFSTSQLQFDIQNNQIIFYQWPQDLDLNDVQAYLESKFTYQIVFDNTYQPTSPSLIELGDCLELSDDASIGESDFLPELSHFFPTILAQPHIIGYSTGYQSYDKVFGMSCLPVSIGDQFSLYQFKTISYGHLYFGIEACVWAIFEARAKSLSLINADYYVALPFTYLNDRFSLRFRLFHQSSHLGDEFLLENPKISRVNPSMEVADLTLAYDINESLTVFGGYSRVLRSDDSFKMKPNCVYYGLNYYLSFCRLYLYNVEAVPYVSAYFANSETHNWRFDSSATIGYEWNKPLGHKVRIYLEGHDGFSPEGQFGNERTRYLALKISYGY